VAETSFSLFVVSYIEIGRLVILESVPTKARPNDLIACGSENNPDESIDTCLGGPCFKKSCTTPEAFN
jgi:hypothetical protein